MVINKLKLAVLAMAISFNASAGGSDARFLVGAKLHGMCGTFGELARFQKATKMKGGDEFIERFLNTESARLGMSPKRLFELCDQARDEYTMMYDMLSGDK